MAATTAGDTTDGRQSDVNGSAAVYMYRIDLRPPPWVAVDLPEGGLEVVLGHNAVVRVFALAEDGGSQRLFIRSGSFPNEAEARTQAERLVDCLPWIGCRSRLGLELEDTVRPGVLPYSGRTGVSVAVQPEGIRVVTHEGGLTIYETDAEDAGPDIAHLSFHVGRKPQPILLQISANEAWSVIEHGWDGRVSLAMSLYNAAQFERSTRTHFLLLVTTLEVLADRTERTGHERMLIESFMRQAKEARQSMAGEPSESLLSGLAQLRFASIGESIGRLVQTHISDPVPAIPAEMTPAEFARRCYKIRNDFVHGGRLRDDPENEDETLSKLLLGLDWLVWTLLPGVAGVSPSITVTDVLDKE